MQRWLRWLLASLLEAVIYFCSLLVVIYGAADLLVDRLHLPLFLAVPVGAAVTVFMLHHLRMPSALRRWSAFPAERPSDRIPG